ncbi:hypothetical protein [Streptomyces sp. NPDC018693]|uniref:hypothetical protein n=1 Tax=unclassified Streptomyces TaxID=2593676 RepID=UPI0037AF9522
MAVPELPDPVGPVVNAVTHTPLPARAAVAPAGRWYARREPYGDGGRGTVLLWPDTFTTISTRTRARPRYGCWSTRADG